MVWGNDAEVILVQGWNVWEGGETEVKKASGYWVLG